MCQDFIVWILKSAPSGDWNWVQCYGPETPALASPSLTILGALPRNFLSLGGCQGSESLDFIGGFCIFPSLRKVDRLSPSIVST